MRLAHERLEIAVLPRAPWFDEERCQIQLWRPLTELGRGEFRSVVGSPVLEASPGGVHYDLPCSVRPGRAVA